jgi:hypothetical protein
MVTGLRSSLKRPARIRLKIVMTPTPQQRLRLLQIERVKPLSEPPVNRGQQFARLPRLTLVTPEACEVERGTQLEKLGSFRSRTLGSEMQDYFCSTPSASMTRKSAMCLFFSTHAPRPLSQVLSRAALFG